MRIRVRVRPGSSRDEVIRAEDGTLHVRVRARPEKGEANSATIAVVARFLDVPKSSIRLVGGGRSRDKLLEVPDRP
ncbi:MAG: DUF167 domain-containing protein [candidate division WOR-3 bacterium]